MAGICRLPTTNAFVSLSFWLIDSSKIWWPNQQYFIHVELLSLHSWNFYPALNASHTQKRQLLLCHRPAGQGIFTGPFWHFDLKQQISFDAYTSCTTHNTWKMAKRMENNIWETACFEKHLVEFQENKWVREFDKVSSYFLYEVSLSFDKHLSSAYG